MDMTHAALILALAVLAWDVLRRFAGANQWASQDEYEALHDWLEHSAEEARVRMTTLENRIQSNETIQACLKSLDERVAKHGQILTRMGLKDKP